MEEALTHATPLERADLCDVRVVASTMEGALEEAVRWGRDGLRALGEDFPELAEADLEAERRDVEARLSKWTRAELLGRPEMKDPADLTSMKLLADLGVAGYFSGNLRLWELGSLRRFRFAIEHGTSVYTPVGFSVYATVRSQYGDHAGAYEMSRLGIELGRRIGGTAQVRPPLYHVFFIHHWRAPLATGRPITQRSFELALEWGDFAWAAYALGFGTITALSLGIPLRQVIEEAGEALAFAQKVGHTTMVDYSLVHRQAARALLGLTHGARFDDAEFDEESFLRGAEKDATGRFLFFARRLEVAYLLRDLDAARAMLRASEPFMQIRLGFICEADHRFYAALTRAALADDEPEERAGHLARMAPHAAKLALWAENAPDNFAHKHALVLAEMARVEGRDADATRHYDEAIEGAGRTGFVQDEALAYELAGRFHLARGRSRVAAPFLRAAVDQYGAWNAVAKVQSLQKEMAARKLPLGPGAALAAEGAELDLRSLLEAAETLSAEVVFDRLVEKLLKTCLEAAGAERVALVVEDAAEPVVRAMGHGGGEVTLERIPLERARALPRTVIEHVRRTGELVLLDDAARTGRFVSDPVVAARSIRSIMAVPLERHAQRVGVLYFENNLAAGVFGRERAQIFELLSAQIAVSLENSRLFENLEREIEHRRHVEAQMSFLATASAALAETLAYEPTLRRIARLAVPFLGEACWIDVATRGKLQRLAAAHVDPAKEPLLEALQERYPPDWGSPHPAAIALRTGEAQLFPVLDAAGLRALTVDEGHARLVEAIGVRTCIAVPLVARGRTLGAMTFVSARPGHAFGADDLTLAKELARRAALAIDNARLYAEAQDAVRIRDEFLSIASHELRTPIASLQLVTEGLLKGRIEPTPERMSRAFRNAHRQIVRLTQLIDELLTASSIAADRLVMNVEEVDLCGLVSDSVEIFAELFARAGCEVHLDASCPVTGRWDRHKLEQVVTNLLSNAVKFAAGQAISIGIERAGDSARLIVRDRGIGIPAERLAHVFDRYERAVSAKHYGGLGLGLYIVKSIVEAHGGTVRAESTGDGTTFVVELPVAAPAPKKLSA
jgi:signal transduction histidine kinase